MMIFGFAMMMHLIVGRYDNEYTTVVKAIGVVMDDVVAFGGEEVLEYNFTLLVICFVFPTFLFFKLNLAG